MDEIFTVFINFQCIQTSTSMKFSKKKKKDLHQKLTENGSQTKIKKQNHKMPRR